ncbi:MAG: hypothetical protein ACI810_002047 [Gammaproteobacteria bacterium]
MKRQHLIFLHLPKAGGSTLRTILNREYGVKASHIISERMHQDFKDLEQLDEQHKQKIKLLIGHMGFGVHAYLPGPCKYISMLRDPIERVVSEYRYIQVNQKHVHHEKVKNLSLMEFLSSGLTTQVSNGQTRLLSGMHDNNPVGIQCARPVTQLDFDEAVKNIEAWFPVLGLVDKYEETLLLWKKAFGWRWPWYAPENVNPSNKGRTLSEGELAAVTTINEYDIKLYQIAQTLFHQNIKKTITAIWVGISLLQSCEYPIRSRIACKKQVG